jgi:hypothetical protein
LHAESAFTASPGLRLAESYHSLDVANEAVIPKSKGKIFADSVEMSGLCLVWKWHSMRVSP